MATRVASSATAKSRARQPGVVMRRLVVIAVAILAAIAAYWVLLRDRTVTAQVYVPELASTIGSDEDAVGVSTTGRVVRFLSVPAEPTLPRLPLDSVPQGGKLAGNILAQAKVLGAAPKELRSYLERSEYGESGVAVILTDGIELLFGDASQAKRKWKAAAAVLANPSITTLDGVNLLAPSHPAVWGSEHSLPPAP
jgi:hypothetical protein